MPLDTDPTLTQAYRDFFGSALALLRAERATSGKVEGKSVLVPTFLDIHDTETSFGISRTYAVKVIPDFTGFVLSRSEKIKSLPELGKGMDVLRNFVEIDKYAGIDQCYFLDPLIKLAQSAKGFDVPISVLEEKVREVVNCIQSGTFIVEALAVLDGFSSESARIQLSDSCWIRKLDLEGAIKFWEEDGEYARDGNSLSSADYLLQATMSAIITNQGKEHFTILDKLKQALFILRLLKRGKVHLKDISIRHLTWAPIYEPRQRMTQTFFPRQYRLSQAEADALAEYWRKYAVLFDSHEQSERLAVSRFASSYDRESPHDKIIDCFIGLEALLIKDDRELGYKLRLRTANLLGLNRDDRQKIFSEIRVGYDLRSKIVHGNDPGKSVSLSTRPQSVSIHEFAEELERYLARALMRLADLRAERPGLNLIEHLDRMALST
jgi:hypothetical protein